MKAFPVQGLSNDMGKEFQKVYEQGMDLIDYFAAKAMQGLISREDLDLTTAECAKLSYELANAMMEVKNK